MTRPQEKGSPTNPKEKTPEKAPEAPKAPAEPKETKAPEAPPVVNRPALRDSLESWKKERDAKKKETAEYEKDKDTLRQKIRSRSGPSKEYFCCLRPGGPVPKQGGVDEGIDPGFAPPRMTHLLLGLIEFPLWQPRGRRIIAEESRWEPSDFTWGAMRVINEAQLEFFFTVCEERSDWIWPANLKRPGAPWLQGINQRISGDPADKPGSRPAADHAIFLEKDVFLDMIPRDGTPWSPLILPSVSQYWFKREHEWTPYVPPEKRETIEERMDAMQRQIEEYQGGAARKTQEMFGVGDEGGPGRSPRTPENEQVLPGV